MIKIYTADGESRLNIDTDSDILLGGEQTVLIGDGQGNQVSKSFNSYIDIKILYNDATSEIQKGDKIIAPYKGYYKSYRVDEIKSSTEGGKKVLYVSGIDSIIYKLVRGIITDSKKWETQQMLSTILNYILGGTNITYELEEDKLPSDNSVGYEITAGSNKQDILNQLLNMYDVEITSRAEVKGTNLYGEVLLISNRLGVDDDESTVTYEYGYNANNITRSDTVDNYYTRFYVVGKDGLLISDVNDGSPYLVYEDVNDKYNQGSDYLDKYVSFSEIDEPNTLKEWAVKYIKNEKLTEPNILYEVSIGYNDKPVGIGDSVRVYDKELDIRAYTRVLSITSSITSNIDTVVLGNYKNISLITPQSLDKALNDVGDKIKDIDGITGIIQDDIGDIKDKINNIDDNIGGITQDIGDLSVDVGDIQDKIGDLVGDIPERIEQLETDIYGGEQGEKYVHDGASYNIDSIYCTSIGASMLDASTIMDDYITVSNALGLNGGVGYQLGTWYKNTSGYDELWTLSCNISDIVTTGGDEAGIELEIYGMSRNEYLYSYTINGMSKTAINYTGLRYSIPLNKTGNNTIKLGFGFSQRDGKSETLVPTINVVSKDVTYGVTRAKISNIRLRKESKSNPVLKYIPNNYAQVDIVGQVMYTKKAVSFIGQKHLNTVVNNQGIKEDLNGIFSQLNTITSGVQEQASDLAILQSLTDKNTSRIKGLMSLVDKVGGGTSQAVEAKATLEGLLNDGASISARATALSASSAIAEEEEITDEEYDDMINSAISYIDAINDVIDIITQLLVIHNDEIKNHTNGLDIIDSRVVDNNQSINILNQKVKALEDKEDKDTIYDDSVIKAQLSEYKTAIDKIRTDLDNLNTASYDDSVIKADISRINTSINNIQSTLDNMPDLYNFADFNYLADNYVTFGDLANSTDSINSRIDVIDSDLDTAYTTANKNKTDITKLTTRVSDVETKLANGGGLNTSDITLRLSSLESKVNNLPNLDNFVDIDYVDDNYISKYIYNQDIDGINNRITSVSDTFYTFKTMFYDPLQTKVNNLVDDVDEAYSKANTAYTTANKNKTDITKLTTRVVDLESEDNILTTNLYNVTKDIYGGDGSKYNSTANSFINTVIATTGLDDYTISNPFYESRKITYGTNKSSDVPNKGVGWQINLNYNPTKYPLAINDVIEISYDITFSTDTTYQNVWYVYNSDTAAQSWRDINGALISRTDAGISDASVRNTTTSYRYDITPSTANAKKYIKSRVYVTMTVDKYPLNAYGGFITFYHVSKTGTQYSHDFSIQNINITINGKPHLIHEDIKFTSIKENKDLTKTNNTHYLYAEDINTLRGYTDYVTNNIDIVRSIKDIKNKLGMYDD